MKKGKANRENRSLRGSLACKLTAFFVLAVCSVLLIGSMMGNIVILGVGYEEEMEERIMELARADCAYIIECFQKTEEQRARDYCAERNVSYRVISVSGDSALGMTYNGAATRYRLVEENIRVGRKYYNFYIYVDDTFPIRDDYWTVCQQYGYSYKIKQLLGDYEVLVPVLGFLLFFIAVFCGLFLMLAAGHQNGREGIVPGLLTPIPMDGLTVLLLGGLVLARMLVIELRVYVSEHGVLILYAIFIVVAVMLLTVWLTEWSVRLKLGKWWQNNLIYSLLQGLRRGVGILAKLAAQIPLVPVVTLLYVGITAAELTAVQWISTGGNGIPLVLEKAALFFVVIGCGVCCRKLLKAGEELSRGNLGYKLDTAGMILHFKRHAENLNHIGEGMTKAVEERMKSEHLKTELITNVSHDLKTPLTSIINYADLLGNEGVEPEKVKEYAEVLLRQSRRLKKLLDDLMEASKAATGNVEVIPERCEVGVMMTQAAGEYEKRFAERELTLLVRQPEEPVYIMADGRHLGRIFDNLMNNIFKYAQEHSRVYLTLEREQGQAVIIFRNMSKYELEISGEELQERFVRGDKSRHMEGNGLGLSIAKSLTELQQGTMEIVTDGDLFKVLLRFPVAA